MWHQYRPINITIYGTEVGNGFITWDGIFIPYSSVINPYPSLVNHYYPNYFIQEDTCTNICSESPINTIVTDDDVDKLLQEYWDCVRNPEPGDVCLPICFDPIVGESIISCCIDKYCAYRRARDAWLKQN
ncbi:hypothetical protein ACM6RL_29270 [Bacillus thuringiensis]|uniref:hypothetical protein n=1 Tax=Bacillus thuringiensis TaxID=1428 RepID=UPI0039FC4C56